MLRNNQAEIVRLFLIDFERNRNERVYSNFYSQVSASKDFGFLTLLSFDELTKLKRATNDYLYGNINVIGSRDSRWEKKRKLYVEAEQREFLFHICQARMQVAKSEALKSGYYLGCATYQDALRNKIECNAREVIVRVPYVYPPDKALIHNLIVSLYKGEQNGDIIRFSVDPNEKSGLEEAVEAAKIKAFSYYNRKRLRKISPEKYGIWIYIDDYCNYPGNNQFSGTSFTLAVAVGIWACLNKSRIDAKVAFSGDVLNNVIISNAKLKAKAARLSGVAKFYAFMDFLGELDAYKGVNSARKIQLNNKLDQRPETTEVINITSLEEVLKSGIVLYPNWRQILNRVGTWIRQKFLKKLIPLSILFILTMGALWFNFDRPKLVQHSFFVHPDEVIGCHGDKKQIHISAKFTSRLGTTAWLKLTPFLHGQGYWIHCSDGIFPKDLPINKADYSSSVTCEIPQRDQKVQFQLKSYYAPQGLETRSVSVKVFQRY